MSEIHLCENCGQRVRFVVGDIGRGAWQHIWSMSIYCSQDGELRAEPAGASVAPR